MHTSIAACEHAYDLRIKGLNRVQTKKGGANGAGGDRYLRQRPFEESADRKDEKP